MTVSLAVSLCALHLICAGVYKFFLLAEVIEGIEPAKLQTALQGQTVKVAQRKGKHMWLDFDAGPSLMLHFGKLSTIPCSLMCLQG